MFTSEAIDQFLDSLTSNGCSPNTARAYRADVKGFLDWVKQDTLGPAAIQVVARQYMTECREQWSPKTTKRKMASIRSFGRFIGIPLLEGYRGPKVAKPIPHPIPEGINGVLEMIMECDTPQQKALIALCGLAGLRVSEARAVKGFNFTFDPDGTVWLKVRGKGDSYRTVPVNKTCMLFVRPLLADQHGSAVIVGDMADRTARAMVTRMGAKAALSRPVKSHDLRATFATAAYDQCKDLRVVQELLGHADSSTTEVYTGTSPAAMKSAINFI